jgi:hypothetical protein
MELIKRDLPDLELTASDLSDLFLRLANPDDLKDMKRGISQRYLELLTRCAPEERSAIRSLVSTLVVFGAMRGLQWGDALSRRHRRRKQKENGKEWSLLRHGSIVALLRKSPSVSTTEICKALDKRGERLPWGTLPRKERNGRMTQNPFWVPNARHQYVKSLITRARNKIAQIDEDSIYLKAFDKNRGEFKEHVKAVKKDRSTKSAATTDFFPGMK